MKHLLLLYNFFLKSKKMKVLVTGANGLLGHHVVSELLKRKHIVRIILRGSRNIYFDMSEVESINGNFTHYETIKIAAEDCDAIIHIAAVTATNLLHYKDYSNINVDGVAQIIKVAEELKINKLVFVSSANTIGYGIKQQLADERSTIEFPFSKSFYAQSKLEAEQLIIEASKKPNQHVVIVNPTFMLGAYDSKPSSGKLLILGYKRKLMFTPKGGKNFVAVSDVATAVCNAIIQGKNGERYLTSGVNYSFKEYYKLQKQVGIYKQFIIEIPDFLLISIGIVGDMLRKFGIKTNLCSMNLRQLMIREYYNNQKAKTELNLPDTNLKMAINEAIDWFKEKGMI